MQERSSTITARRTVDVVPFERPTGSLPADHVEGPTVASLVSPGTELNSYYDPVDEASDGWPATPGYAAVFTIERAGPAVAGLVEGDRALAFYGAHASWQRWPAAHVVKVPDGLGAATATFARMMAVSIVALSTTQARPPAKVGVSGLGIVGHLAAKQFAAAGYNVVAWDPESTRRTALAAAGITVLERAPTDDRVAPDDPDGSGDLQLVVECSGNERAVLDACASVRKGGEVILVGVAWRPGAELAARDLIRTVFFRYVTLRSGWEWQVPLHSQDSRLASTVDNLTGAMRWLAEGRIDVSSLATVVRPERAAEVYAGLRNGTWPALSAIFDWTAPAAVPPQPVAGAAR